MRDGYPISPDGLDLSSFTEVQLHQLLDAMLLTTVWNDSLTPEREFRLQLLLDKHRQEFDDLMDDINDANSRAVYDGLKILYSTALNTGSAVIDVVSLGTSSPVVKFAKHNPRIASYLLSSELFKLSKGYKALARLQDLDFKIVIAIINSGFQITDVMIDETEGDDAFKRSLLQMLATKYVEIHSAILSGAVANLLAFQWTDASEWMGLVSNLQEFIPIYGSFVKEYNDVKAIMDKAKPEAIRKAAQLGELSIRQNAEVQEMHRDLFVERIQAIIDAAHANPPYMPFSDVPWYSPWYEDISQSLNLLSAENTDFRPEDPISQYEMLMMVRSFLSLSTFTDELDGGIFEQMDELVGLPLSFSFDRRSVGVTRGDAAELLVRGLYYRLSDSRMDNSVVAALKIESMLIWEGQYYDVGPCSEQSLDWLSFSALLRAIGVVNGGLNSGFRADDLLIRGTAVSWLRVARDTSFEKSLHKIRSLMAENCGSID